MSRQIAPWCLASGLALLWAALLVSPIAVYAQGGVSASSTKADVQNSGSAIEQYWTSQRLLSAQPMELHPQVGADGLPVAPTGLADASTPVSHSGAPPSVEVPANAEKVLIPRSMLLEPQSLNENIPYATSSFGAYFSTRRVFPSVAAKKYPYITAGRLFFTEQGVGDFVCSASVISPRIVVTAGHCVVQASTSAALRHFYTNWLFVPAYRNGNAPFGSWTVSIAWITNAYFFSDGSVPNPVDFGMLVMDDQAFQKIGNVTGWLGWQTNVLSNNHVTMIGYSVNLDNALKVVENSSQTFASGGNNTYIYGSPLRAGSSGTPWIQDFGKQPVGAPPVVGGGNLVIGVTSYGPVATEPAYSGASNLDSQFVDLFNAACGAANSGNC